MFVCIYSGVFPFMVSWAALWSVILAVTGHTQLDDQAIYMNSKKITKLYVFLFSLYLKIMICHVRTLSEITKVILSMDAFLTIVIQL